ncbi:MAG: alpha/beta hydrolase [Alphaproteobacteria bacterium]|nr:alpha/beta hydrolase [Alphaproteobacteria bacterium]
MLAQPVPPSPGPKALARPDGATIAYHRLHRKQRKRDDAGAAAGVVFLGGYRSDMTGAKALALEDACARAGRAFVRFDYRGHGQSQGRFEDLVLGDWIDDALRVIDGLTEGPQVLVGSSMGGWIMLHAALRRPDRVAGLVGVAAAPDFTEDLMWARFAPAERETLMRDGVLLLPSAYSGEPTPVTRALVDDGRARLLLAGPIAIGCPVRLLHGMADPDVPWEVAPRLAARLASPDVRIMLVKDGDHRLSRPQDLDLLAAAVEDLASARGAHDMPQ